MQFQFSSDNRTTADARVAERIETLVRGKLEHVVDRLSRVEVHVRDGNGSGRDDSINCTIELRPIGMKPISASDEASGVDAAVGSATDKALTAYSRQVGKQTSRKGH